MRMAGDTDCGRRGRTTVVFEGELGRVSEESDLDREIKGRAS
jgi:hypothetical protein